MVKQIDENIKEIKISVMSKKTSDLKSYLSLADGDTLVLFFDRNKYDIDEMSQMADVLTKQFPHNKICMLFDDMALGVIKND